MWHSAHCARRALPDLRSGASSVRVVALEVSAGQRPPMVRTRRGGRTRRRAGCVRRARGFDAPLDYRADHGIGPLLDAVIADDDLRVDDEVDAAVLARRLVRYGAPKDRQVVGDDLDDAVAGSPAVLLHRAGLQAHGGHAPQPHSLLSTWAGSGARARARHSDRGTRRGPDSAVGRAARPESEDGSPGPSTMGAAPLPPGGHPPTTRAAPRLHDRRSWLGPCGRCGSPVRPRSAASRNGPDRLPA